MRNDENTAAFRSIRILLIGGLFLRLFTAIPTITYRPKDVAIDQHGEAIFICEAEGNPSPIVFWSVEGNRTLIFPGEKYGKFRAGTNKEGQTVLTVQVRTIMYLYTGRVSISYVVNTANV